MGAAEFIQLSRHKDASTAYQRAVEQAGYDHGHGGYSGTIVEKAGFEIVDPEIRTERAAYSYAQQLIGDYNSTSTAASIAQDKWGPAAAIPVCTAVDEVERQVTLKVDVDPGRELKSEDWINLLRAEGKIDPVDTVGHVQVSYKDRTRLEAKRTEGKAVIRYFYANAGYSFNPDKGNPRVWVSGFTSMAEWRKHAKALVEQHGGKAECVGITRRFDDEPLDVVQAVPTKRTATITTTVTRPGKKDKLTTDAWLFFGFASC